MLSARPVCTCVRLGLSGGVSVRSGFPVVAKQTNRQTDKALYIFSSPTKWRALYSRKREYCRGSNLSTAAEFTILTFDWIMSKWVVLEQKIMSAQFLRRSLAFPRVVSHFSQKLGLRIDECTSLTTDCYRTEARSVRLKQCFIPYSTSETCPS